MIAALTFSDLLSLWLTRIFRSEPEPEQVPTDDPSRSADYCHSHGESCDAFKDKEEGE